MTCLRSRFTNEISTLCLKVDSLSEIMRHRPRANSHTHVINKKDQLPAISYCFWVLEIMYEILCLKLLLTNMNI